MSSALTFPEAPYTLGAQLEVRAAHPELTNREFLVADGRSWTWKRYRDECVRMAHFLRRRLGLIDDARPGHVAMILENHFELLALSGGCAYAGLTLFGINTGLRGEVLAGVLNQSRARVLVVDQRFAHEVAKVVGKLDHLAPENILVLPTTGDAVEGNDWLAEVERDEGAVDLHRDPPEADVAPDSNLMVIYTSGTTGLPKGINNNHFKLLAIGIRMVDQLQLGPDATGYACMPLFHSNAMFLGFQPAFWCGGRLAMRERFSASNFARDVLAHGVTYWNYVGEPVHYILNALDREHGSEAAIRAAVAEHPDHRFRYAIGNGASPPDIDRFVRYLGLDDMFELYGSTEAAISTFRRLGDPRGSVGEVTDPAVKILSERGTECPPAVLDADGKITNYGDAVGEICRVAEDTALFQGYFDNADANESKYRDGVYHSGDLGHILLADDKRFLYFDGRTDDWIRKDGENFSAAQVARLLQEHPDIELAAAYGVPCPVSDEWVMAAMRLRKGARFDPAAFFAWCEHQVEHGAMDRKWFPDFLRLVEDFSYTQTQKVLVRELKKDHFHRDRLSDEPIYWRERGDSAYRTFDPEDFRTLRKTFVAAEREELVDR
jgi:fatty-acyl-CoA synthase